MFCTILEVFFIFVLGRRPFPDTPEYLHWKESSLIPNLLSPGHLWTINILVQDPILARTQSENLLIRMMEWYYIPIDDGLLAQEK